VKSCARCCGLMWPEDVLDGDRTSRHDRGGAWRCINCGEIIDQVIVLNRRRVRDQRQGRRESFLTQFAAADLLDELITHVRPGR